MANERGYSFLNEVWGQQTTQTTVEPNCVLSRKGSSGINGSESNISCVSDNNQLDNIMDAYIGKNRVQQEVEPTPQCRMSYDNNKTNIDRVNINKCSFGVDGYNLNSMSEYASLDSFYTDDATQKTCAKPIAQQQPQQPQPQPHQTSEETYTKEEIYRDTVERYNDMKSTYNANSLNVSEDRNYTELVVYILSGIFLIFMMEQILQIGKQLR